MERARGRALKSDGPPVSFMEAVFDCPPKVRRGTEAPLMVYLCEGARAEVACSQGVPLLAQLLLELAHSKSGARTHAELHRQPACVFGIGAD